MRRRDFLKGVFGAATIAAENYEYKWTSDFKFVEQLNGKKI